MSYHVTLRPAARKTLKRLGDKEHELVLKGIHALEDNPLHGDVKPLSGFDLCRLRVGVLRLIDSVNVARREVYVERVARRSEKTYRGL